MWNPNQYLETLQASNKPRMAFNAGNAEELREWQSSLRTEFKNALGHLPIDHAPLDMTVLESVDCGSYMRKRVEITTFPGMRMPAFLLIPKQLKQPAPAVIACHGHGYGSKEIVGLQQDGSSNEDSPGYSKNFALELVREGYVTIVPELLGFGDRKLAEEMGQYASCHRISTFLLAFGETMAGYRVYETMRCIDALQTLPEVDGGRIGIMGISGGGLVASFLAAIDDRIRAAVVSGYFNTFQASILGIHHCVDNYIPGLSRIAEMSDIFGLIAPRPLLIESGTADHIFPYHAVLEAYAELEHIYGVAGASEQLDYDRADVGHEIIGNKAYKWFERMQSST